eukprot:6184697-Pleurochrysis_carterae.AAC.2
MLLHAAREDKKTAALAGSRHQVPNRPSCTAFWRKWRDEAPAGPTLDLLTEGLERTLDFTGFCGTATSTDDILANDDDDDVAGAPL